MNYALAMITVGLINTLAAVGFHVSATTDLRRTQTEIKAYKATKQALAMARTMMTSAAKIRATNSVAFLAKVNYNRGWIAAAIDHWAVYYFHELPGTNAEQSWAACVAEAQRLEEAWEALPLQEKHDYPAATPFWKRNVGPPRQLK